MAQMGTPKDVAQYVKLALESLSKLKQNGAPVGRLIANSYAVVFIHSEKAALLTTYERGHGFLLGKLTDREFTGPVYLLHQEVGVGVAVGRNVIDTVIFLKDEKDIETLFGSASTGFHGDAKATLDKWTRQTVTQNVKHHSSSDKEFLSIFHLSQGVIFDMSVTHTMVTIDEKASKKFYGSSVALADILNGQVAAPAEYEPLYAALKEYQAGAASEPERYVLPDERVVIPDRGGKTQYE